MHRNAEGRVVLTLDENFCYGGEGEEWESVQTARTTIVLAETLGRDIWASVHKQRSNAIELALKDGARVEGVAVPGATTPDVAETEAAPRVSGLLRIGSALVAGLLVLGLTSAQSWAQQRSQGPAPRP
ncbi:hypothetical protein JKA73_17520 [Myxococcus xanthus]|uniref:hypothetical protein n=1 Tax=Myxococcus xanthus TaxID=34 RepID=UPI0019174750|nr:hypothetical protein [Myxococcus xanthus]QQR47736.1 hypothetical protein JKA73_17520 [Myxococcus xanthus]